jgi:hypothetical protein
MRQSAIADVPKHASWAFFDDRLQTPMIKDALPAMLYFCLMVVFSRENKGFS